MDMVERVARAIWEERCRHWGKYRKDLHETDSEGYDWEDLGLSKRKELLREARAALAAMREPTLEMVEAADAAMRMKIVEWPKRLETLRHGYMAAISAALTSSDPLKASSE